MINVEGGGAQPSASVSRVSGGAAVRLGGSDVLVTPPSTTNVEGSVADNGLLPDGCRDGGESGAGAISPTPSTPSGCRDYGGGVIICSPSGFTYRAVVECPSCKRRSRHLVRTYVWYGPEVECGACGNRWSDGEGRRESNKQKALNRAAFHAKWLAAGTRADAMRWLHAQIEAA